MIDPKTIRALTRLLSYPDEQTLEAAELLFIILQDDIPDAADHLSEFGRFLDQHHLTEIEEAYTGTFDIDPTCALEVGWHLFGEEYERGQFLVRMRQELRKFGIQESPELPDHITHVLSLISQMPSQEAKRFVTACVLPAVNKMHAALKDKETPYRHAISCLALVVNHNWGTDQDLSDNSETAQHHQHTNSEGVDLLHAFPVADVDSGCGGGCSGHCGSTAHQHTVQLTNDFSKERSQQS